MSVKELVKSKSEQRRLDIQNEERKAKQKMNRERLATFNKEINDFIWEFERRYFKIDSTEEEVADAIHYTQTDDSHNYVTGTSYKVVNFDGNEEFDQKKPSRSKKFNEWKQALEDKFGITMRFYIYERQERRFGNSGFETYPNYIYEGICVVFGFK